VISSAIAALVQGDSVMKRIVLFPTLILVMAAVLQAGSCTFS